MTYTVVVNVALGAATLACRRRPELLLLGPGIAPVTALSLLALGQLSGTSAFFATAQGLAWWLFLHVPLGLLACSRSGSVLQGRVAAVAAVGLASLGAWSSLVEPFRLGVSHVAVPCDSGRMRIALLTDIQTDDVGDYERRVFETLRAEAPDLVLFAGDYVQVPDNAAYVAQTAALAAAIGPLHPPLGAWAVRGDVDGEHWEQGFADTGVHVVRDSTTFALQQADGRPFWLTALATPDSRSMDPPVPSEPGLHIVFGHAPDFVLSPVVARSAPQLVLAGHTHGGQIQVPGFGPLLTLTKVPRAWASGVTPMDWGGTLVVSRGIGMERLEAPRVRFWCAPEIVVLDLGPS